MNARHTPVMLKEMLEALDPNDGENIVDATFGAGGYSHAILQKSDCVVWAIDRDPEAIERAKTMDAAHAGRFTILQGSFGNMEPLLKQHAVSEVDGIVMDLGVSSPQLDDEHRGFSFRYDGPLDMRMALEGPTAADFINAADEERLADIIHFLGEERLARRIARAIVSARSDGPIERTGQLANIIRRVVPKAKDGLDPATRTFMALRLHINDELGELDRALNAAERLLAPGGRLVVVAFHSLEDRRVKRFLDQRTGYGMHISRHAPPAQDERAPSFVQLKRRPVKPSVMEIQANPRARSARLRAARRTAATPWPQDINAGAAA
ncbi:MAG: 16S rRNA (cytosine(1402)-N(4))-methyltransferase RsmH [Proteobacteria bacterium]|nr:16S rRNA (cytosine(1402)-N(4))-methyltransferase RsmH [Pseudomonadota bacterium]